MLLYPTTKNHMRLYLSFDILKLKIGKKTPKCLNSRAE